MLREVSLPAEAFEVAEIVMLGNNLTDEAFKIFRIFLRISSSGIGRNANNPVNARAELIRNFRVVRDASCPPIGSNKFTFLDAKTKN
jgi:hypothetical protein